MIAAGRHRRRASEGVHHRGDGRAGTNHILLGLLEEDTSIEVVFGVSLQQARRASIARSEAVGCPGHGVTQQTLPLPTESMPKKPTFKRGHQK